MKIVFYNIAYGTGLNGSWKQYIFKIWRFFWLPFRSMNRIAATMRDAKPDVLCLAEVDSGSFRNRFRDQTKHLSKVLGLPFYHTQSKYHSKSAWQIIGVIRKQHDAILSKKKGELKKHQLTSGMKKLVQEYVIDGLSIFTLHLAVLSKAVRKKQMQELAIILKKCPRPHVVCGDFNTHKGLEEIAELLRNTGLRRVIKKPSFPSVAPKRYIDLFLASPEVKVLRSGVIKTLDSDHLPVWVEVEAQS